MTSRELTQGSQGSKKSHVSAKKPGDREVHDSPNAKHVEISARTGKPKRRKAVRACTNCQRTHLTCDDDRPCERCIKRGCANTCVDGERKTPRRARSKTTKLFDPSDYPPDLLAGQGPPNHTLVLTQEQPHLLHLQQFSLPPNNLSHPSMPDNPNAFYLHHMSQQAHLNRHASGPDFHGEGGHSRGVGEPDSALDHKYIDRMGPDSHSLPPKSADDSHHDSLPLGHGPLEHPHPFEPYRMMPDYYGGMEPYHLPSQSPLQRYAEAIHGPKGGEKDLSVISAMLQRRNEEGENGTSDAQHPSDASNGCDGISCSNDEDSATTMPWIEPTNPLVTAHNEQSRRFSYNYEHTDPSEVYKRVTEPFPNRQSFHKMIAFLKNRLEQPQFKQLTASLSKLKAHFDTISRPLSNDDHLFVEQSFQRSLLEEEKQFALTPVPCLVWRRTGVVTAVSPRFTKLTQWTSEELKSEFLMRALDNDSILRYFENFQSAALRQVSDFKFDCTILTPSGSEIHTEAEVTIRKDLFNMPLTILGRFWAKS